jgi:hypothetical protein
MIEEEADEIHPEGERLPLVRLWVADAGDEYVRRLRVAVAAEGLEVEADVVDGADDGLVEFFGALD